MTEPDGPECSTGAGSSSSTTTRCSGPAYAPSSPRSGRVRSRCSPRPPTSPEAVAAIREHHPDVVLLDVHLPGGGGVEVMHRLARGRPSAALPRALGVATPPRTSSAVIRAGARGYVTKTITGPELVAAIAARGRRRRRLLAAAGRLRARRLRRLDRGGRRRRGPGPAHRARARGDAADRPRLRLQGDRPRSCSSRSRPSRPTCPACCASCSSPPATS